MKKVVYDMSSFFSNNCKNLICIWLSTCTNMLTLVGFWEGMIEKGKGVNKLKQEERE